MHRLLGVDPDSALASRDKAMFELFYSSGLRLSELTGLAPSDVNHADGTVRVTGKGSKTRVVPVGAHALKALDEWLQTRAAIPRHEPTALFVSRTGKRLSPRSVQQRLKTLALKQGLTTDVHPHVLRHSFASHVLQSSGDLRAVQEMLGHASISTTQVYTHLDFQHLAKVYDAAHPRAKKRKC
jgi:integrase/recombinase XerC